METHTAQLSSDGDMTSFSFEGDVMRFRTSPYLVRYWDVLQWDAGYLVVNAEYSTTGVVEDYIDLVPMYRHLMRDPESCLRAIQSVEVCYA